MAWVSPTGDHDAPGNWQNPQLAYDDDPETMANTVDVVQEETWSPFLYLTIDAIDSTALRFYSHKERPNDLIDLDVYKDDVWVHVYEGAYDHLTWTEKSFDAGSVTEVRIRIYNGSDIWDETHFFNEFHFWQALPCRVNEGVAYEDVSGRDDVALVVVA